MARAVWMERDRTAYYGSFFVHVGVIFQAPLQKAMVLGEPLMKIRYGNSMWTPKRFEIWALNWPKLIWSFDGISAATKERIGPRRLWRQPLHLLSFRARGGYGYAEYRRFLAAQEPVGWRLLLLLAALIPGSVAHVLGTLYLRATGQIEGMSAYELLRCSPYRNRLSGLLASFGRRPVKASDPR
jgi:abequosyltransferase